MNLHYNQRALHAVIIFLYKREVVCLHASQHTQGHKLSTGLIYNHMQELWIHRGLCQVQKNVVAEFYASIFSPSGRDWMGSSSEGAPGNYSSEQEGTGCSGCNPTWLAQQHKGCIKEKHNVRKHTAYILILYRRMCHSHSPWSDHATDLQSPANTLASELWSSGDESTGAAGTSLHIHTHLGSAHAHFVGNP